MNQGAQKRRKVLILITKATWGGAQKYVFDEAIALSKEQNVVVAYGSEGTLQVRLTEHSVSTKKVDALGRDVAIAADIKSFFQIIRLLQDTQPNEIRLHSSKAAAIGALAARLCRIKRIVFIAHGWPFKERRSWLSRIIIYFISWLTAVLSHEVIVVSKLDEIIGKKMVMVAKKITYRPLSLDIHAPMVDRSTAENLLFRGPSERFKQTVRIVSIAELTRNKGIEYGIRMMEILDSRFPGAYSYTIIGTGELGNELTNLVEEKNLAHAVWFLNFSQDTQSLNLSTEASRYLKAFDIYLLPSLKEGSPYVLLEATAAGLPIVSTNVVDQSMGNTIFVNPENPAALADAVAETAKRITPHL